MNLSSGPSVNTTGGLLATWFPLIARHRPPCKPSDARITELEQQLSHVNDDAPLTTVTSILNRAALLASDVGMSDLAESWCWSQYNALTGDPPLSATRVRAALEPVVNLARLAIRDGRADEAYTLLQDLFNAVSEGRRCHIEGRVLDITRLLIDDAARAQIRQFVWTVLLADGTRALVRSGRWREAAARALMKNGIGRRPFDGRQVAILDLYTSGNTDEAREMIDATDISHTAWEDAVVAYLRARCTGAHLDIKAATDSFLELPSDPGLAVFHTRLGLAISKLPDSDSHTLAPKIVNHACADAHAARDVLTYIPDRISAAATDALRTVVVDSGLGCGVLTGNRLHHIVDSGLHLLTGRDE